MIMGSVAHHFNRSVSFNASYMKQYWRENLQEHRTTNSFVPDMNNKPISNLAMMQFVQRKQKWAVDNINAYFNFTFKTGSVHHQALIGYDSQIWEKRKGGQQNAARGFLLKDGSVVSSYNPAKVADYQTVNYNGILLPKPNVDPFDLTPGAENHQERILTQLISLQRSLQHLPLLTLLIYSIFSPGKNLKYYPAYVRNGFRILRISERTMNLLLKITNCCTASESLTV